MQKRVVYIAIVCIILCTVGLLIFWQFKSLKSESKSESRLSITQQLYPQSMPLLTVKDMYHHLKSQPGCLFVYDPKILQSPWCSMNLNQIIDYLRNQGEAMRLMVTPTGIVGWYDSGQTSVTIDRKRRKIWGKPKGGGDDNVFELKHYQHDRDANNMEYYQNRHRKKKKYFVSPREMYYLRTLPSRDNAKKNYYQQALPDCIPRDEKSLESVNFYISGAGITTNLHYDGRSGIVVQLKGRKRIYVFPENQMDLFELHPMGHPLMRRSKIDGRLTNQTLKEHPQLLSAHGYECILEPGTWLYIPARWMHYVESLDTETFSLIVRFTK